ncbi:MAG: hypothetical protein V7K14_26530 [Nostoc sp.]|uniref:hypothetical protein n=1 Tax=unclassified Nostoc TaxID=2593658 RepID=UPI0025F505BA|nr:hypothetical protein [Nostoc sp. NMS7]
MIEDLRRLLVEYYPMAGDVYLFPGRSDGHISEDSASRILRGACLQAHHTTNQKNLLLKAIQGF